MKSAVQGTAVVSCANRSAPNPLPAGAGSHETAVDTFLFYHDNAKIFYKLPQEIPGWSNGASERASAVSSISDWLSQIGLSQYAQSFVANDVTLELLPNLTADDLKDLGVTSVGHRRALLRAIENLTKGDAVADATVVPETPRPRSEAERRRLTVLFCDLAGSTRLAGRLDPEVMRDVLVTYQNTVAGEIGRMEGHLAKFVGDGVLAYFGYPKAHEDDAERAIRAGLAIAKTVARLATPDNEALAVRIGIASGLVVVGETIGTGSAHERSVVGETPNLAARLQSIAAPNQVVISSETRRLIADVFRLDDLGHLDLKGFDVKVRAFHVLGEGQAESRFEAHQTSDLGPMVGRDQELSLLLDRWRQAKAGEGQMALLLGEAGIGKSRLTRGIIDAVTSETHYRLLYQCSPFHTDSALYPVSQRLARAAQIAPEDSAEAALDKLERALALGLDKVPPAAALLAPLLGLVSEPRYGKSKLSPAQQRTRTLEVLLSHLIGLSRRKPVLLVFEDVHWIDPTSLELLDLCLDHVATAPILMVATARPTFEHRFGGHPIVTRLSLNRLGRDQVRTIAERMTAGRMLPVEVIQLIAARTDGVPLFVEELTKTIIESGALREVGGALVLDRPLTDIAVPASLHDSLMARLDRHPGLKDVAQFAACIGREFSYPLLAAVCAMPESALCEALKLLASAELVFARGTPPDAAYVFKHALVRDAAYESLLKTQRRQTHARIADFLEKQFPNLASPEVLAQHHSDAGHEDAAAHWWYVAGQRAIARSANKEALASLTKALAILDSKTSKPSVQDIELDILIALASVATAVHGYGSPETTEIVMRARKACRNSDDVERIVSILYSVWSTYVGFADYEKCRETTVELVDVCEKRDTSRYRFITSCMFGYEYLSLGQFTLAEKHLQTSLDFYVRDEHYRISFQLTEHIGGMVNSFVGLAHYFLGDHLRAMHSVDQALRELKQSKHINTLGVAMFYRSFLLMEYGLYEDAKGAADDLINFSTEQALPLWLAGGAVVKGATMSRTADQGAGIELILKGIDDWRMTGTQFQIPQFYLYLAQAYLVSHQLDEGFKAIRVAHELLSRTGEHWFTAELHRTEGELLHARRRDGMPVIEEALGRALEVARDQHSRTFELRAAMSLAKVWAEGGEQSRARNLLEPVYGWFKEGTDTRDLIEARDLLGRLR